MARVVHFDITAADTARAISFYRHVFGWKISKAPGPLDYWLIRTGKKDELGIDGGLALRDAEWQRITMFVEVDSVDAAARRIVKAGGSIVQPRTVIPGVCFVVGCRDTEDNIFAIIEPDETAGF